MTRVALALLRRGGRWFLQRRDPANPVLPGLWEFPGGKALEGEALEAALRRECLEECGVEVRILRALPAVQGPAALHPFLVEAAGTPSTGLAWGWFTLAEMRRLPAPAANSAILDGLARGEAAGNF